jgi:hypothetical protein
MKTILPTFIGITLLASFGAGLTVQADAASARQRGFTTHCYGTPEQCMRGYRAVRPTPRGYLPQRGGSEYDFPRFGTQRWWQLKQDPD